VPLRDTSTGSAYEDIVRTCIKRASEKNSFDTFPQQIVGEKPGGGMHRVDYELIHKLDSDVRGLISCKYQGTSGTAEEKIAYEVIKLLHTMKMDSRYIHSWIIMGGDGWSSGMREFARKELIKWIPKMEKKVTILSTDQLITTEIKLSD